LKALSEATGELGPRERAEAKKLSAELTLLRTKL
jgi:hypothetical protein